MNKLIFKSVILLFLSVINFNYIFWFSFENNNQVQTPKILIAWNSVLDQIFWPEVSNKLDTNIAIKSRAWWSWIRDYLKYIWQEIMYPIVIIIATIIVIISFFKVMFTENDEEQKKSRQYLLWWVLWILIMTSANYIWNMLVWEVWEQWKIINFKNVQWVDIAIQLYQRVVFPFLKIAIYLVVWILFGILLIQMFKYLSEPSEENQKNAKRIIIWNTVWIMVIFLSKNIVENIYWRQEWLRQTANLAVWDAALSNQNIALFYSIINRLLGLVSLLILAIIIYQTFLMVSKPDDQDTITKLKRNMIYIFVGILFIWWGYIFSNFLIIK